MHLSQELRQRLNRKPILLMTHLVLGYPSFEVNRAVIAQMAAAGVDCIELQIPFSEPIADGPVICRASQEALSGGVTVAQCLDFAQEMVTAYPQIRFLFMTYYNILFRFGEEAFLRRTRELGLHGTLVPDLPLEEGASYRQASRQYGLAAIAFFTPTSTDSRMRQVAAEAEGFIYCVARRGVTGKRTNLDAGLADYLQRCRAATDLPLAVGFGIVSAGDVQMLVGKADMAVIGTATIRLVDEQGPEAVGPFIRGLLA
jgi:tryptophan synthase alpha chain